MCAHVFVHMLDLRRRRNGTGDHRVGDDELQEELGLIYTVDLARPVGKRVPSDVPKEPVPLEGPIDDHCESPFSRKRQQAAFCPAVEDIVRKLDEFERLSRHHLLEVGVLAAMGRGDADVTGAPFFFVLEQRLQVPFPIHQIMNLHQVEAVGALETARFGHLTDTERPYGGPHLGCREQRRHFPQA